MTNSAPRTAFDVSALAGVLPALLVLMVLFGGGLMQALLTSFEDGGAAYGAILEHQQFWPSLWLTLRVSLFATLLSCLLALALAMGLRKVASGVGGRVSRALLQVPLPMPHLVIALAMLMLLSPSGLLERILDAVGLGDPESATLPILVNDAWGAGIVLTYVWKEAPFITVLLLSALRGETMRYEEAARNLGAGAWRVFWTITLPASLPALRVGALLVFAYTFGAFEVPLLLGQTQPTMLGVWAWQLYTDIDLAKRPQAMVVALLISASVLTLAGLGAALSSMLGRRA